MHLVELLSLRAVPAAGVSLGITRRCPLHCSHCSTSSTMESEESPSQMLTNFVNTFTPTSRPQFIAMSGGEALLRPRLVQALARQARAVGTRSSVLSGMFFARESKIPKLIKAAIDAVDHFSVSIDAFHEREVPRKSVFNVLRQLIDEGKHLSMHIAGEHANDPYLDEVVADVKKHFGKNIPMLVNTLSPFGRAKSLTILPPRSTKTLQESASANPCTMAAWPVVGFDGIVAACGNDNLIGNVPSHLRLGDIKTDNWATIQARCVQAATLRALRIYGPQYLQTHFGDSHASIKQKTCTGYCDTCIGLDHNEHMQTRIRQQMNKPAAEVLEESVIQFQHALGPVGFASRFSHPRFSELVMLGADA